MRAGSLDGKGVVYDADGKLMLVPGEELVDVVFNAAGQVTPGWGRLAKGKSVIDTYAGNGNWFITDKRMVFIRKPDSRNARRWLMTPTEFPAAAEEILRTREVVHRGGFDYCEILWSDARFCRRKRNFGTLLLMVSGAKYRVHLTPDMLRIMNPILKKRGIVEP